MIGRIREWILRQMGATEDSPYREEPEKWASMSVGDELRDAMIALRKAFRARAVFILMENRDGVIYSVAGPMRAAADSVVIKMAGIVDKAVQESGAIIVHDSGAAKGDAS